MSISNTLAKWLSDYRDRNSIGSQFRRKRIAPLIAMIDDTFQSHGKVRIIDIGGKEAYWNIIPRTLLFERKVEITIANLPDTIVPTNNSLFTFVEADGCDLSLFDDRTFNIAHSNSVIEHVGDWRRMVQFAGEVSRVAEKYFVQTPNFWFPLEPHFMFPGFHWFPKPIRLWLALKFDLGHWKKAQNLYEGMRLVESARLINKPMFQALFPDATIQTERVLLLPKSYIAIRAQ